MNRIKNKIKKGRKEVLEGYMTMPPSTVNVWPVM